MSEQAEVVKKYYPNGQLSYEIRYHQKQLHGMKRWWYENGHLHYEIPYHQNQQHGIEKWWYENGHLQHERYYLYGEEVTEEEYRKHELVESLACLNKRE